jgi:cytidylate kinase
MTNLVIAIDGPAGAGKSTVSKLLAKRLGIAYLDTGAMYRALALMAKREGISPQDADGATAVARRCQVTFRAGDPQQVLLNGEDVTDQIRTLEMGELASAISTHSEVRRLLVAQQQAILKDGSYVLEGRDATTVIAPEAQLKVFLTASLEERAKRRAKELESKGLPANYSDVAMAVAERDHRDYTREDSPLQVAPDAVVVETYGLSPEEVVETILKHLPQSHVVRH